jgi:transcriptional regulator with XRE-family HTH domain
MRVLPNGDLARQLGLDSSTVSAWERDEVRHPYPRIRRVFEHWLAAMEVKRPVYRIANSAPGTSQ